MKNQIINDLHQEIGSSELSFDKADLIVIAAYVNLRAKGIEWIRKKIQDKTVIYVPGNHESYRDSYPKDLNKVKAPTESSNVHILVDSFIDIFD